MDFSSDANANFEGLLEVNREICMPQMAEKTSPDAPPNCAVVLYFIMPRRGWIANAVFLCYTIRKTGKQRNSLWDI